MVLICICLIISDIEQLFMPCWPPVCLRWKHVCSAYFLTGLLVLLLNCIVLYIFWILKPCWMHYLQIPSPFSRLPFGFGETGLCLRNTDSSYGTLQAAGSQAFACEKLLIHYILEKRNQQKKKKLIEDSLLMLASLNQVLAWVTQRCPPDKDCASRLFGR